MKARNELSFSLVEVTLALGVAAFALIAVYGLLPIGLNSNRTAIEQTAATNIATSIVADLRATFPTSTTSPRLGMSIPAAGSSPSTVTYYLDENGGPFPAPSAVTPNSRYRATISWIAPATGTRTATLATIALGWPAPASTANAAGSVTVFVALDRN